MKRKIFASVICMIVLVLAAGTFQPTRCEIQLTDSLSVAGFLRYELGLHIAQKNPNNAQFGRDNNDLNLARSFFQMEWTYKPCDSFKIYSNMRITGDQTYRWDDEIAKYNAFPVDVPDDDWTMLKASKDDYRFEIWELYADFTIKDLWLRLGKQQIVWGEMIGGRILDAANNLDRSWNFLFEPEEFENIRIPVWSIRASYNIKRNLVSWLNDLTVEGYLNPGDVVPTIDPESGSPFNLRALPGFLRVVPRDNRGKMEYGMRVGGMVGGFYATLNYMHLHNQGSNFRYQRLTPDPIRGVPLRAGAGDFTRYAMIVTGEYEPIDLYGLSMNYDLGDPLNAVVTFEGAWIPNQPYGDAATGASRPEIKDQGTWKYAIRVDRLTQIVPKQFLHSSMCNLQFQFTQTVVEGDENRILGGGNSKIDKTVENLTFQFKQPFWHNDYYVACQFIYDTDDAWLIKPQFRYQYGDDWYFDIYAVFLAGSERRAARFGSMYWADTLYGRVTFQF
ncbi:MAG: hypothetical protein JXD19_05980 [Deltaproteobacteria bacterium]|nr:hypothetical protein [Deltaproteobacteria bacterium]